MNCYQQNCKHLQIKLDFTTIIVAQVMHYVLCGLFEELEEVFSQSKHSLISWLVSNTVFWSVFGYKNGEFTKIQNVWMIA